jgi:DNA-binding transcriptional ArsR family regulator
MVPRLPVAAQSRRPDHLRNLAHKLIGQLPAPRRGCAARATLLSEVMTGEEGETPGFRLAPQDRTGSAGPLPAKIELNIVRETPNLFAGLCASLGSTSISSQIKPVLDSVATTWARLFTETFSFHLDRLIPRETFERLREAVPPNWVAIEDSDWDVDWDVALETMSEGIPLIWVPGPSVVSRLLKAGSAEQRLVVLDESRQEIVEDCTIVLEEVTAADLLPLAGQAAEAARALRDGHCAASQALSANIFDTWLRDVVRRGVLFALPPGGRFKYPFVLRQIQPVDGSVGLAKLKASGALTPVIMALAEFDPEDGVSPTSFGRHATAHAVGPEQYSDVNAVIAMMLTTSVLRQAQASGW